MIFHQTIKGNLCPNIGETKPIIVRATNPQPYLVYSLKKGEKHIKLSQTK